MTARELRSYVLSHHEPSDYDRCLSFTVSGKEHHVCSRCAGWYSSFLLFWIAIALGTDFLLTYSVSVLYLLPVPAMVDWGLHRFGIYNGTNLSRVSSGLLLGLAFGALSHALLTGAFDISCCAVSILYGMIAGIVVLLTR